MVSKKTGNEGMGEAGDEKRCQLETVDKKQEAHHAGRTGCTIRCITPCDQGWGSVTRAQSAAGAGELYDLGALHDLDAFHVKVLSLDLILMAQVCHSCRACRGNGDARAHNLIPRTRLGGSTWIEGSNELELFLPFI